MGSYAGSYNVGDYIRWRVGNVLCSADRLAGGYHRPDLVAAALSGKP